MKILVLTNNLNAGSGWGRYSLGIVCELKKQGHEVVVVCETENKSISDIAQIRLFVSPLKAKLNFITAPYLALKVWKMLRNEKVDAIQSLVESYGFFAMILSRFLRCPYYITVHGTFGVKFFQTFWGRLIQGVVFRKARKIFCVSRFTEKQIVSFIPLRNTTVIHAGSTSLPTNSSEAMVGLRKKYDISEGVYPILLTVGAVKDRKGQMDTVRAVEKILSKYPHACYLIVGDCSDVVYTNKIRSYIAEHSMEQNVRLIDTVSTDSELAFFYQICDIFLLNSTNDSINFEGFGLVVLEANQFGKPAIGSRNCGIEDSIKDGVNGYLTEPRDSDDIKDKIVKVLEGANKAEDCKNWYNSFSWEKTVNEYINNYKETRNDKK